jgi:hypothetical protein
MSLAVMLRLSTRIINTIFEIEEVSQVHSSKSTSPSKSNKVQYLKSVLMSWKSDIWQQIKLDYPSFQKMEELSI